MLGFFLVFFLLIWYLLFCVFLYKYCLIKLVVNDRVIMVMSEMVMAKFRKGNCCLLFLLYIGYLINGC